MTQTSTSPPYATPSPTLRTPAFASSVRYPPLRLPIRPISRSDLLYARLVRFRLRISNHFLGARSEVQCFSVLLRWLGPLFKKTVADSNAPVQEKALDALLAFQRAADADASRCVPSAAKSFPFMLLIIYHRQRFMELSSLRYAKEVCDAIVAKCLTGRPKTVEKAQAAFLLWVELEAAEVFLVS